MIGKMIVEKLANMLKEHLNLQISKVFLLQEQFFLNLRY